MNARGRKSIGASSRLLGLMGAILVLGATAWPVPMASAAIKVGEDAPAIVLEDEKGAVHRTDEATTRPLVLLFVKPGDVYTSRAIASLNEVFARHPELGRHADRLVIVSRIEPGRAVDLPPHLDRGAWRVLHDRQDAAYRGYQIIATPTIILVSGERRVAAVHAGYDAGMPQHVRLELAKLTGVELPRATTQAPEKPNMTLQMGRRLAARGMWERALGYYEQAAGEETLPAEAQCEMAAILVEMDRVEEALRIAEELEAAGFDGERLEELRERIRRKAQAAGDAPQPPSVHR